MKRTRKETVEIIYVFEVDSWSFTHSCVRAVYVIHIIDLSKTSLFRDHRSFMIRSSSNAVCVSQKAFNDNYIHLSVSGGSCTRASLWKIHFCVSILRLFNRKLRLLKFCHIIKGSAILSAIFFPCQTINSCLRILFNFLTLLSLC